MSFIRPASIAEPVFEVCKLGKVQANRAKSLTRARNRPRTAPSRHPFSPACSCLIDHACHFAEKTVSRRPFPHRAWPLRHQTDQEGLQDRPLFRAAAGFPEEEGRRDREQISVRAQQPVDHRRLGAQEHRPLYQPRLQAERGIRRQSAQAQGGDPRHQEHRAGRRDQLRLRHRLLQGVSEADRLQMRRLREEAQEEARRGDGPSDCA